MNILPSNIKEFGRMFGIPIPVPTSEYFEHYISVLARSDYYAWVPERLEQFVEFEQRIDNLGAANRKAVGLIKNYILNQTSCEQAIVNAGNTSGTTCKSFDKVCSERNADFRFLSIDIVMASWSVLRYLANDDDFPVCEAVNGESAAKNSWAELLKKLEIDAFFAKSKSFRQFAIGNTWPKQLQSIMHEYMMNVYSALEKLCLDQDGIEIVRLLHDEIVIRFASQSTMTSWVDDNAELYFLEDSSLPLRLTTFALRPVDSEGTQKLKNGWFVKPVKFMPKPKWLVRSEHGKFGFDNGGERLYNVPGRLFYPIFRTSVLHEPIETMDCGFVEEGRIAHWDFSTDGI